MDAELVHESLVADVSDAQVVVAKKLAYDDLYRRLRSYGRFPQSTKDEWWTKVLPEVRKAWLMQAAELASGEGMGMPMVIDGNGHHAGASRLRRGCP